MDFDLTQEHQIIRDMTRQFAYEVIAPRTEEMDTWTNDRPPGSTRGPICSGSWKGPPRCNG